MPAKLYKVNLTSEEQESLKRITRSGKHAARKIKHAQILLQVDTNQEGGGLIDAQVAKGLQVSSRTVERVRQSFVEEGLESALNHKRLQNRLPRVMTGEVEAKLCQIACSQTPDGQERWTMQMLANELIALEIVETISDETVRTTLKKMNLSPG